MFSSRATHLSCSFETPSAISPYLSFHAEPSSAASFSCLWKHQHSPFRLFHTALCPFPTSLPSPGGEGSGLGPFSHPRAHTEAPRFCAICLRHAPPPRRQEQRRRHVELGQEGLRREAHFAPPLETVQPPGGSCRRLFAAGQQLRALGAKSEPPPEKPGEEQRRLLEESRLFLFFLVAFCFFLAASQRDFAAHHQAPCTGRAATPPAGPSHRLLRGVPGGGAQRRRVGGVYPRTGENAGPARGQGRARALFGWRRPGNR